MATPRISTAKKRARHIAQAVERVEFLFALFGPQRVTVAGHSHELSTRRRARHIPQWAMACSSLSS